MKTKILFLFILISFSCKSQTFDIYNNNHFTKISNAYYKDLNNYHNLYVGRWLYTNGTTSLEIVFRKKNYHYSTSGRTNVYKDFLIGEYKYIENGVQKVNTLDDLNIDRQNIMDYNIVSMGRVFKHNFPKCDSCGVDDIRIDFAFNEPDRRYIFGGIDCTFVVWPFEENGVQKIKIWFKYTGNGLETIDTIDGEFANVNTFNLPYGEYILTKQP